MNKKENGFSVIELILVIIIIVLIGALVFVFIDRAAHKDDSKQSSYATSNVYV